MLESDETVERFWVLGDFFQEKNTVKVCRSISSLVSLYYRLSKRTKPLTLITFVSCSFFTQPSEIPMAKMSLNTVYSVLLPEYHRAKVLH